MFYGSFIIKLDVLSEGEILFYSTRVTSSSSRAPLQMWRHDSETRGDVATLHAGKSQLEFLA